MPSPAPQKDEMRWLGGATVLLRIGGLRLLTDPMLGPRSANAFVLPKHPSTGEPMAPIARHTDPPIADLGGLNAVIVSHLHADHFDEVAKRRLSKQTYVVAPPSARARLLADGFTNVHCIDWGERLELSAVGGQVDITGVPAHHAKGSLDNELGKGNGYLFRWTKRAEPRSLYWTGDAVFSEEMLTLRQTFGAVDTVMVDMGAVGVDGLLGRRSMDAEDGMSLLALMRPTLFIPIHHTTFGHYREPIAVLLGRAESAGLGQRLRVPAEGDTVELP
jgi:L-ascorbate metabolism protein UlaG (beta-lactamase superfamily)